MEEKMEEKRKLNLQLFAQEGDGSTGENGEIIEEKGETSAEDKSSEKGQEEDKKFSQADMDKVVQERLNRENKKFQKQIDDLKKQFTAGGDGEGNANAEGTQSNTEGNNDEVQKLIATANQRLLEATALAEATKLGVDPKYVADVVRLADLSTVEIGENGAIEGGAVSAKIDEVLKRVPVFKQTAENSGGFKIGGDNSKKQSGGNSWNNSNTNSGPGTVKRWNKGNRII